MRSTGPKWDQRSRRALAAATLLLGAACAERVPAETSPLGRAKIALSELVEQDGIEVAECRELADRCSGRFMGAAPAEVCTRLARRCDALETRLRELREPALLCWRRSVQMCAEHGDAARARCHDMMTDCGLGDRELSRSREPVLTCDERVEVCLVNAAEVAESGVTCARLEASCARMERRVAAHGGGR